MRVHFADGHQKQIALRVIADYLSEEGNRANKKVIAAVEISIPSPLLVTGVSLVHVPGIASLFGGNHASTSTLIPRFDAAIVVLATDPPISREELALIDEVERQVKEIVFVLNQPALLGERSCDDAVAFTQRILTRHFGRPVGPVFRIRADRWLDETKGSADAFDERLLMATLGSLVKESGARSLRTAERRGLLCLSGAILAEIERFSDSLVRPLGESRRLLSRLSATISQAEWSLNELALRFKSERNRVSSECAARRERFLSRAIPQAFDAFRDKMASNIECLESGLWARAGALAEEIASHWLDLWLTEETPSAVAESRELTERFVKMANNFLDQLANSGDPACIAIPGFSPAEIPFAKRSLQYDGEYFGFPRRNLLRRIGDSFQTRHRQLRTIERDIFRYLDTLLSTNASFVVNDLDKRVNSIARNLESRIRLHLRGIRETASHMLIRVEQKQRDGGEVIMQEVRRMEAFRRELLGLQELERPNIINATSK